MIFARKENDSERKHAMEFIITPPNQDPYFFDREELQAIADERTVKHGLRSFRDKRVMEVDQEGELLWARVEDG